MKDNSLNHLIGRIVYYSEEFGPHKGPYIIKEHIPNRDFPQLVRVESLNWKGFVYQVELEKLKIASKEDSELILILNDIGLAE
jgi:hypothetical protein